MLEASSLRVGFVIRETLNHLFRGLPQVPRVPEAVSVYLTQSCVLDTLGGDDGHGGAEVKMYDVVKVMYNRAFGEDFDMTQLEHHGSSKALYQKFWFEPGFTKGGTKERKQKRSNFRKRKLKTLEEDAAESLAGQVFRPRSTSVEGAPTATPPPAAAATNSATATANTNTRSTTTTTTLTLTLKHGIA